MEPRLKTSKKWTAFPKEYTEQVQEVFQENFAKQLGGARLVVEGRIYTKEIMLRVGFLENGRLTQTNFEVSVDYSPEKKDALESINISIDAAASMMADYFENDGEVDFPRTWKPYPFQSKTIFLQFTTENSELEAEANRLLGETDEVLVHEEAEQESEDALVRAEPDEELSGGGIPDEERFEDVDPEDADDEEEGAGSPRMFGGGKKKKKTTLH